MCKTKMLKYKYIKNYNLYVQTMSLTPPPPLPEKTNKQNTKHKTKPKTKMLRLKGVKDIKKYIYE